VKIQNAVIATATRTPFGRYRGGLSAIRTDDLLAFVIRSLMSNVPSLDPSLIDDVIIGDSNGAGEDNRNVARMSLLLAGLPVTVPGVTVNRLCGSSAEAIVQAARMVALGEAETVLAGGVESMSRAPWIVERLGGEPDRDAAFHQSTVGWRLVNPLMKENWTQSLGRCAEIVAQQIGISRESQDEWALRSHSLAAASWDSGFHAEWAVPFGDVIIDESIRRDTSMEKLRNLKPAFSETGEVTAGNSSPLNDGSTLALITNAMKCEELGLEPLGTILATQVVATHPDEFTRAPIYAIRKVLSRMHLSSTDIDVWEINEAFAAMVLTVLHDFPEIKLDRVNVNGGAIAMGHPVGASAGRVVVDCARELKRRGGGIGIATACIGVGQGIAVVIESK